MPPTNQIFARLVGTDKARVARHAITQGYASIAAWLRALISRDLEAHGQPPLEERGPGAPEGNQNAVKGGRKSAK